MPLPPLALAVTRPSISISTVSTPAPSRHTGALKVLGRGLPPSPLRALLMSSNRPVDVNSTSHHQYSRLRLRLPTRWGIEPTRTIVSHSAPLCADARKRKGLPL